MDTHSIFELIQPLNEDEQFYKEYFFSYKSGEKKRKFLASLDLAEIERRHLVVPDVLPEIISYNMDDSEYFPVEDHSSVYISRHNRYTPAFLHQHSFFEIVFVLSGRCVQTIGLKTLYLQSGDICFIAPGTYHTIEVFDDNSLVFNILLRRSTFHQMFTPLTTGDNLLSKFFSEGLYKNHRIEYLAVHTADDTVHLEYFLKMYSEQLEKDAYTDQILVGMLTSLTALVMRNHHSTMETSFSSNNANLPKDFSMMNYLQEHMVDVTLEKLAEHFGYSVSHCSRMIKTYTGQGFNDWKRILRLRRAEHLLINSNESIADIGDSLGYMNPETFIRAFKKEYRVTPSTYRKLGRVHK